jgi:hypothetical protein
MSNNCAKDPTPASLSTSITRQSLIIPSRDLLSFHAAVADNLRPAQPLRALLHLQPVNLHQRLATPHLRPQLPVVLYLNGVSVVV